MNLSKNAMGNLINRYKAVLKKCHLLNTFGSLALAGMLAMGSVGVVHAEATPEPVYFGGTDNITNIIVGGTETPTPPGTANVGTGQSIGTFDGTTGTATLTLNSADEIKLGDVLIDSNTADGAFTVTANKDDASIANGFASGNVGIFAGNTADAHTSYIIEAGLTHTVHGSLFLAGNDQGAAATQVVKGNLYVQNDGDNPHIIGQDENGFLEIYKDAQVAAKDMSGAYSDLSIYGVTVNLKDDGAALGLAGNADLTYSLEFSTISVDDGDDDSSITGYIYGDVEAQELALDIGQGDSLHISGDYINTGNTSMATDGDVHIAGNYSSEGFNFYNGDGSINVAGTANFKAGAFEFIFVRFNAGDTTVIASGDTSTGVITNAGGELASLKLQGGDAVLNNEGIASFGVYGGELSISGDVSLINGEGSSFDVDAGEIKGVAGLQVLGGESDGSAAGEHSILNIGGTISGDGLILMTGGDGADTGEDNYAGGDAIINLAGTVSNSINFQAFGGNGGQFSTNSSGSGGAGGDVIINNALGGDFYLKGGAGGEVTSGVDGKGGAGGDVVLHAAANADYGTIQLFGGSVGEVDPAATGTGGAGGKARFEVMDEEARSTTIEMYAGSQVTVQAGADASATPAVTAKPTTLTVRTLDGSAGEIHIAGADSINTAVLKIGGEQISYADNAELTVNIGAYGTLDLSGAFVNNVAENTRDSLVGDYNLNGGTLKMDELRVDADTFVAATTADVGISFEGEGALVINDILTIGGDGVIDKAVNVMTQRLAADSASPAVHLSAGKFTFRGDGVRGTTAHILTDLTVSDTAKMLVSYTADEGSAVNMEHISLAADKVLDIQNENGLNILGGAVLNVSEGTLKVADGGFAHLDPDVEHTADKGGKDGIGVLIVDNDNMGFSASDASYTASTDVQDKFWGSLQIKGFDDGASMSFAEYNTYLVGGENALIQGLNASLRFVGVEVEGVAQLDTLISGTSVLNSVNIGSGKVMQGGSIAVGSVSGDYDTSIVIGNDTRLSISGVVNEGALFQNNGLGKIQVEEGELQLGNADSASTLNADIVLGSVDASTDVATFTEGDVTILGEVDAGFISSAFVEDDLGDAVYAEGSSVNVVGGGKLTASFELALGNALNITAAEGKTAEVIATDSLRSVLGDLTVTAGAVEGEDASFTTKSQVFVTGDATFTSNGGTAALNILASDATNTAEGTLATLVVQGDLIAQDADIHMAAGHAHATGGDGGSAALFVGGTFESTNEDLSLVGGDAAGVHAGGDMEVFFASANLNDVDITSGLDASAGGLGGSAVLIMYEGSVDDVLLSNKSVSNNRVALNIEKGHVAANSVTLTAAEGAKNAVLGVADGGSLTVQNLDARKGYVEIFGATLKADAYTESAATELWSVGSRVDLSNTSFSNAGGAGDVDFQGSYNIMGGSLKLNNLTLASTDLYSKQLTNGITNFAGDAGAITFDSTYGGILETNTLTFSDTSAITLDLATVTLVTSTLNSASAVTADGTFIVFSGGGTINADLSNTNSSYIRIGKLGGVDGSETAATTTTLADGKTLDIQNIAGLLVYEGHHLNTSAGTLKVTNGGFFSTGTGTLSAKHEDFGTFTFSNQEAEATFSRTDANVQDLYYGDLVITGLTGQMSKKEYDSFLINATNAMIEGDHATLYFDGVSVVLPEGTKLSELGGGSNFKDQVVETDDAASGETSVDVNNGGKVVVGAVEQSDPSNPVDLNIKKGTTLALTGENSTAAGNSFDKDIYVEAGAGLETGSANAAAKLAGDVTLKGNATDGTSQYVVAGDTEITGSVKTAGGTSHNELVVEQGAHLTAANVDMGSETDSKVILEGGSALSTTKLSATSLEAENAHIDVDELELGTQGGSFSGTTETNAADIKGTFFLGNAADAIKSSFSSKLTNLRSFFVSDPDFDATPEVGEASTAAHEQLIFDSSITAGVGLVVAQNSVAAVGTSDTNRLVQDVLSAQNDGHLVWGNDSTKGQTTTAALGLYQPLTMTSNALILVDGSYKTIQDVNGDEYAVNGNGDRIIEADGSLASGSGLKLNEAHFTANSLLVVNAHDDGIAVDSTDVALTGVSGSKLFIRNDATDNVNDAKLHIVDGKAGILKITDGFDGNTAVWDDDALSFSSDALTGSVEIDSASGDVYVKIETQLIESYNFFQSETTSYLNANLIGVNGVGFNTKETAPTGQMFLSRALSKDFGMSSANEKRTTATIEGAAQVGAAGNAAAGTMAAGLAAGNAVGGRNSGLTSKVESGNTGSVTLNNGEITAETGTNGGNMTEKSGLGVWLTPLYKWSTGSGFESGGLEHGYDMGLGGIALGVDFTNKIAADSALRFGLSFNVGAGYADSTGDYNETNNDFNFWGLIAYGAFQKENFVATLDIGFTSTYNEITQDLPASMLMGDLNADVDSLAFSVGLNLEYTFNAGMMDITPHAGVRFMSVTTDEYDIESSYGLVATVEEDTQNVWYFPVGVTFSADIESNNGWTFTPKLDLGFIAAAGDLEATSKTRFTGVPGTLELAMQNVDGFAFNGGVGFELSNPDNGVSIGLNYNLQAGEKETGHMIFANFRYDF